MLGNRSGDGGRKRGAVHGERLRRLLPPEAVREEGIDGKRQAVATSGWCEEIARQVGSWPWLSGLGAQDHEDCTRSNMIHAMKLLI